jgi:solute:Na+ symporter, SSS family
MFWRRTTANGAFWGLLAGTIGAALHHGFTLAHGAVPGVKGGYFGLAHTYPSEMAQTFWTAIVAWVTCFVVTILVSFATTARPEAELRGLVYALTPKPHDDSTRWWTRPGSFAVVILALILVLNIVFF